METKTEKPVDVPTLEFERPIVELEKRIDELQQLTGGELDLQTEIKALQKRVEALQRKIFDDLSPWQRVLLSRHPSRPYTLDYISRMFTDFTELHGDRRFADDPAIVSGFAHFCGEPVLVLGHQKGRTTKENVRRNFGMPKPEGYRKALRLMELAGRFGRPVICFVDTAGAYPGLDAEERGQAEAIAKNLEVMSNLPVPILCAVIGEGGSGGALALGVADRIFMLENSVYSVISPEGCASILWRDDTQKSLAAEVMKITANDLKRLKIIDEVVPEARGGAHRDWDVTAENLKQVFARSLADLSKLSVVELRNERYAKFRQMGQFVETTQRAGR
jgi:acetyl-CoA carboxylase carboxyl transferase subunit alpha